MDNELAIKDKLQNTTDLMTKIEGIVNQAVIETKKQQDGDISNKKMIEGINLNRATEKRINRQNEAFVLSEKTENVIINETFDVASSQDDIIMENDIAILKEKQRGRLNGWRQ